LKVIGLTVVAIRSPAIEAKVITRPFESRKFSFPESIRIRDEKTSSHARTSHARAQAKDFTKSQQDSHKIVTNVLKSVGMDIDALHSALLSIAVLSEKIGRAREDLALSDGAPPAIDGFLNDVERD
jgi:hypothetical protein